MNVLNSRKIYPTAESFKLAFIESLTPGVIARENFIAWRQIDEKFDRFEPAFEFYKELGRLARTDEEFSEELVKGLLSSDNPLFLVQMAFQLLGHTGDTYVSNVDFLKLSSIESTRIENPSDFDTLTHNIASILCDLGLRSVVTLEKLENYFIGVQVGLESNRRKNVGGEAFRQIVKVELDEIVKNLNSEGIACVLDEEDKILYSDGKTSKRVDFSIRGHGKVIGIEVNFYTASGSKPTEIKRSYGQVNAQLEQVGALLIWITDGVGYSDMKKSLMEARDIHPNIYNLIMAQQNLLSDLREYLK